MVRRTPRSTIATTPLPYTTPFRAGADKISINSPALEHPELIEELARDFGSQCVVLGVDSLAEEGDHVVKQYTGTAGRMRGTGRRTLDWVREATDRGAGAVLINCMSSAESRVGNAWVRTCRSRGAASP